MHAQPHQPPGEAAESQALEGHDGTEASDRGHAAEVDVLERHRLVTAALQPAPDRAAGEETLLHGDLGDARKMIEAHHVADHEHLRMTGQRAVGQHRHPAGAVDLRPRGISERLRQR